jgi:hypothetical protein
MGYSKKLYNVLGGYKCIIADRPNMVNAKFAQTLQMKRMVFSNFKQKGLRTLLW